LEGLDISELRLSEVSRENEKLRIDDTFFNKLAVLAQRRVEAMPHVQLGEITSVVRKGIFDINSDAYTETGVPFVRITNLQNGLISTDDIAFIPPSIHAVEGKTALFRGDIVLSKTAYAAAAWVNVEECNVSQDTVAVRFSTAGRRRLCSGAVVVFLNSAHGRALMWRQFQGNVQAHLSLPDAKKLPLPIFGERMQQQLERSLVEADALLSRAKDSLAAAEQTLLHALGLDDWRPLEPLTYVRRASEVAKAARFDALYFSPAKSESVRVLAKNGAKPLSTYVETVRDMVAPGDIGGSRVLNFDVGAASQAVIDETSPSVEDFDSAKKRFRTGDVIISRLRHYLRQIAVVRTPADVTALGSSEFIVLRPRSDALPQEALVLFLRCLPVQTILEYSQDGSHHPRFSEEDLLAIPTPDALVTVADELTAAVRAAHAARREAQALLARAQRAVEVAIEQGEPAAMKLLE